MSKNKKPRPKKSKAKIRTKLGVDTTLTMSNLGLCFVQGMREVAWFNTGTGRLGKVVTKKLSNKIYHEPHKWNFLIAVLCHAGGEDYFAQAHVVVSEPVLFDELGECLAEHHYMLQNWVKKEEQIRLGWIGIPKDVEFDDDKAYDLFNTLRGFSTRVIGT